ncbi:MAG: rhomboid family intramembrane serine protease [Rikenellaceae bacterium]|nr:rhomboid family intramembrane serine protease [Rikenellaceae bacterium]
MITYIIIFVTSIVSILCFNNRELFDKLSLKPYKITKNNEWYRIITHSFVHGDYIHLIINMFVLYSFGSWVEELWKMKERAGIVANGTICYLILYFGGMIIASINDVIKNRNNPNYTSIGASGAVSAVIFTSIFFYPWNKIYFFGVLPIPGLLFGILYLAYSQYMSKKEGGIINHLAHFYGAVYGFLFPILINSSFIYDFLNNF